MYIFASLLSLLVLSPWLLPLRCVRTSHHLFGNLWCRSSLRGFAAPYTRTTAVSNRYHAWIMGKSAKVHKRRSVLNSISSHSREPDYVLYRTKKQHPALAAAQDPASKQIQRQARKAGLKGKVKKSNPSSGNTGVGVLGGADRISLMGGAKGAKEEAAKLTDSSH